MLGTITVTLRPLKFAFLVHPQDQTGLRKAIELNTVLWGGQFNPIIPAYRRLPPGWQHSERLTSARDVFAGYLDAYDPDYVVPVGRIDEPPFPVGDRTVLNREVVLGEFEETGSPGYGVGLFDLLRHFVRDELRFKRRFPLKIVLPEPYKHHSLFLASVLGVLPQGTESTLRKHWTKPLGGSWQHCDGHSYAELLKEDTLFPMRLSSLFVGDVRRKGWQRENCLFVMDATRITDIIDFWNLRAIGWNVVPAPIQFLEHPDVQNLARQFIDENFFPYDNHRSLYSHTTVLNSKNVTEGQVTALVKSLKIPENHGKTKVSLQRFYPRIWVSWARQYDNADACDLEADIKTVDIPEGRRKLRLKTLDPKFMHRFDGTPNVSFANMIDMKFYGASDLVAEVMPEGGRDLIRAVGGINPRAWRFSRSGMTYLSSHKGWSIHLDVPDAETVFVEWFRQHGWSVVLSSAGRIAKQTFLALGGTFGVSILTNEDIVKLLERMSDGKPISKQEFVGEISRIANLSNSAVSADRLRKRLTDDRLVRLGVDVQCPICTQHSWYSLEDVAYTLQCMKCLERFDVPSHSPKGLAWSYRSFGPFSLPGYAQGSYSVLLTYHFFSRFLEGATTAIMSFNAESGKKKIEADLGLFFNPQVFGRNSTVLLFAECKSYGRFEQRDVERMTNLGAEFPGAILVFSTLRKELRDNEKRMLWPAANRGRKYSAQDPNHNPVLVLTGIELFEDGGPPECWRNAGGKFAEFADSSRGLRGMLELCDCTQQLHLDMNPYHEWFRNQSERRLGRKNDPPLPHAAS